MTVVEDLCWLRWWSCLERLSKTGTFASIQWSRSIVMLSVAFRIGVYWDHSNVDCHIVSQVLVPRNEGGAMLVLETDAAGSTLIDAVEILYGGHNRISCIMRVYLNAHGYPCPDLGVLV